MLEIEKKFLIPKNLSDKIFSNLKPVHIRQAYLEVTSAFHTRIRHSGNSYTKETKVTKVLPGYLAREETSEDIPKELFEDLYAKSYRKLEKSRCTKILGDIKFDLDIFFGNLAGIRLVEIEFPEGCDTTKVGDCKLIEKFCKDVTEDPYYLNQNLATL
jgi:adenylate cyclase